MLGILILAMLTASCGEYCVPDPPKTEIFELVWESRTDPNRSIIGCDYQQLFEEYFICTGDIEDPPTLKYFDKSNGEKTWEYVHQGSLDSKIVYNKLKESIYIGITNDGVFGFDLQEKKMIWEINLSDMNMRFGWGMTIRNDHIYMPVSWMQGQINIEKERILKIHYLSGEMETFFELESKDSLMNAFSAPVFWNDPETGRDIMYFNNQNWNYNLSPQQTSQDMYAVDIESGNVIWCNAEFSSVASNGAIPPVLYNNNIITGGDWSIYSFDAITGNLNWKSEFIKHKPFPIWSNTKHLISENRIYVNNGDFDIRCLNAETGDVIWHNIEDAPNCSPTMIYYEDMLVYTSWAYGSIMVLDAFTGEKIHQELSHNNSTFNTDVIYDPEIDMFFTTDYLFAYGFKINKPE